MASEQQVRQYLAYWMQLGKRVLIRNGEVTLLPQPVIRGDRYSDEFESCWRTICAPESGDCYLEGTTETVAQLLTPAWALETCARCSMPIPRRNVGMPPMECPCNDLPSWPNTEIPSPRSPIDTQAHLNEIRNRLRKTRQLS